jgi:hypothetical protein
MLDKVGRKGRASEMGQNKCSWSSYQCNESFWGKASAKSSKIWWRYRINSYFGLYGLWNGREIC